MLLIDVAPAAEWPGAASAAVAHTVTASAMAALHENMSWEFIEASFCGRSDELDR